MESMTCLEIQNKVKEVLEADTTLSSYVQKFEIGNSKTSRKLFPYITVAEVTDNIQSLCIGKNAPDLHTYTITIQAGTFHMLPEIACEGNGSDKKGIVELIDDIVTAVYPGNMDGTFKQTIRLVNTSIVEAGNGGGRSMTGTVIVRGTRKQ